jgi:hypothetical protein
MKTPTCIYCGQLGPFTDEHIFPAGLGGDDRRFLLKNLVCRSCNTDVFSKLEAKFMRNSPVALARVFLQARGARQGKNVSIPKFETSSNTVSDPKTGCLLEAELQVGGKPVVLPQIVMTQDQLGCTGPDAPSVKSFLERLTARLGEKVQTVEKQKQMDSTVYTVTKLSWSEGSYKSPAIEHLSQPPSDGIWIEGLSSSSTHAEARFFLRPAGQIVLRVDGAEQAVEWLTLAKSHLPTLSKTNLPASSTIRQPSMHIGMSVDLDAYSRVLAKIGMNFVVHAYGDEYCRHPAFDDIKVRILSGNESVPMGVDGQHGSNFGEIFSAIGTDNHVLMLLAHDHGSGHHSVLFVVRIFGESVHVIRLADKDAPAPPIYGPIFMTIDYTNHVIELHNLLQMVQKVVGRHKVVLT